jgi:hypothetical protein
MGGTGMTTATLGKLIEQHGFDVLDHLDRDLEVEALNGGHEHRLFAGQPGSAFFSPPSASGQDIGLLECTQPAYIAHPEHAYAGIAPGTYTLRRQRKQADEERFVAD